MATKLKPGDRVKWSVGQGETTGKVTQKITDSTTVEGKEITATSNKPRYLIENDSTGNISVHKAKSLSLIKQDSDFSPKQQETLHDFQEAVNMTASEIKSWLKTKESHSVGQKDKNGKIKGRKSGKKIVKILEKDRSDYTKKDFKHMKKVVGYVHRHLGEITGRSTFRGDLKSGILQADSGSANLPLETTPTQKPNGDIEETPWRYSLMNWGNNPSKND